MLKARATLPIAGLKGDILQLLQDNNVQVVCGETGSGKTTQVPQFILDDMIQSGRGGPCNIICTQPWRIAAISVADRVADERCEPSPGSNGSLVGYQVRLHSASNEKTKLLFCTTGILLRKFVGDRNLTGITHVIVDEVHKRSLLGDYLLIVLKNLIEIGNPYALLLAQKMGEKVDVLFFLVPRWLAAYIPICLSCKVVKCITAVIAIPVILVCAVFLTAVYVRYKLRDCRCTEIDLKSTKNGRSGSLFQKDLGKIHHVASIMVTRDVASREFDITHVAQVVNFDFSKIIDDYFHRIGHPGMVVEFIKESKNEVPNWLINHAQQSLYYGGGQSQGYTCLLNHRMEFLCMPHSEIAIFWIWLPTPPLRLKVWVLNRHGLIVIKAQMLIGDAFLKIELMFDNESHIISTGAIAIRLVCHFGTDLQKESPSTCRQGKTQRNGCIIQLVLVCKFRICHFGHSKCMVEW
ncbi:putative RNA helicase [Rosa chinensis]|uniref:RNA helicase n=1 Tax=Rosa chinensis TaxID=74649 RepID=A0A2P6QF24_ROSCH|nr:putative RNA helicase [Rosa chinensis]